MDVLRGAERSLGGCFGLEVEVEFQPLYHRASLFRDVDSFVSTCGFELFDLRRTFFARSASSPVEQPKGQIVFGDALYFRDWREVAADREHLLRAIGLLLVYGTPTS